MGARAFLGFILFWLIGFVGASCADEATNLTSEDLLRVKLPVGFSISVYASGISNARSLALSPGGTLFIGTRQKDHIYAVRDLDDDGIADQVFHIGRSLEVPNGVAFKDGALFVAEVSRIIRYDNIEALLDEAVKVTDGTKSAGNLTQFDLSDIDFSAVVTDQLPSDRHHGWKYIAFSPDGKLYVPIGAPCNVCNRGDPYATISRMNPDGSDFEIVARGVRNSVGFDWHPESGDLWFSDNGRDNLGDNIPPDEINRLRGPEGHFGFPFVHAGTILDPEFGQEQTPTDLQAPMHMLGAHVAPLGMEFYKGASFPDAYRGQLFVTEHGSWNRSSMVGYRIATLRVDPDSLSPVYSSFAEGWLTGELAWGRPVDVEMMFDGSLLVSDDLAGVIYRIAYTGQ
ncbi:MAG: PQQ-dependent sugar dehydrogenase [Bacteroidetes bacterium]|nr:PQQ-dependent sugar dehydrogenase [Bacteroidota bacterium]